MKPTIIDAPIERVKYSFREVSALFPACSDSKIRYYILEIAKIRGSVIRCDRHSRYSINEISDLVRFIELLHSGFTVKGALKNIDKADEILSIIKGCGIPIKIEMP